MGSFDEANAVLADVELVRLRHLAAAELAVAQGDLDRARRGVSQLAALHPSDPRQCLDLALAALTVAAAADEPTTDHAATAFALAMPEAFLFPIAEAGAAVLSAVQEHARHHQRTEYVDRLLRLRPRVSPLEREKAHGVDVLTERERTVLRYLATAMSYSEIAAELFVSINTIKSHVKRITQKLEANSRQGAVDRALELHYL